MCVFLRTVRKVENCNRKWFNQHKKEREKIRVLVVKGCREGSEDAAKQRAQAVFLACSSKNRTFSKHFKGNVWSYSCGSQRKGKEGSSVGARL